jgi:mannose-6-phosphate isomerase-like protein (cupin superfamily)
MTQAALQVLPVILFGGSGSRLWPLSRAGFPKQFLALTGKESFFKLAALRLHPLSKQCVSNILSLIVANGAHRFLALKQLRELSSLKKYQRRAEHSIIVKGAEEVTYGDMVTVLSENQLTDIPLSETHRLANKDVTDLEIIEVQTGNHLGEDDIIRLQDTYGRASP